MYFFYLSLIMNDPRPADLIILSTIDHGLGKSGSKYGSYFMSRVSMRSNLLTLHQVDSIDLTTNLLHMIQKKDIKGKLESIVLNSDHLMQDRQY